MTEREFRQALTRSLPGAMSPAARREILNRVEGREPIVKKKISFAFIVATLLTLLTAAALALGLTGYFEDAARLQKESGYYDAWGLAEKQALIASMAENGLLDAESAAALTDEAAIDAYLIDRYGAQGRADTIGLEAILEKELGPSDGWSAETKAWYTNLLKDAGLMSASDVVYLSPSDSPLKPEEIVKRAQQAIEDAWELTPGALDHCKSSYTYEEMETTDGGRISGYHVSFSTDDSADGSYACALTDTGEIIDGHRVTALYSPAQQRLLRDEEAARDKEFRQAMRAYMQENRETLFAHGGSSAPETWALEDKMAFFDQMRPMIEANMAADPDYSDALGLFIASHRYGLPGEDAIPQAEAVRIATQALTGVMGMAEKEAAVFTTAYVFYDVTDPAAPLWKVLLAPGAYDDATAAHVSIWQRRRVEINALTGEVVAAKAFTILNGDSEAETVALSY